MDDETLKIISYIKISSYRLKTLKSLKQGDKTPTQICKESHIRVSHISKVLKELKECGVAECINEEARKNRIYSLTDFGREIADNIDIL